MKHIELGDSTGRTWVTDSSDEVTPEIEAQIIDLFTSWPDLTNFSLEVDGIKRYFNPAHIVWACIVDEA